MLTNMAMIVVGVFFLGLMLYGFYIVLFSKQDYKRINRTEKKEPGIPDKKLKGKFIDRT